MTYELLHNGIQYATSPDLLSCIVQMMRAIMYEGLDGADLVCKSMVMA